MEAFVLFVLGAAFGSFLDVVATRYDPSGFMFGPKQIGGHSQCVNCGKNLRWFELIPIVSYLTQFGRCRSCGSKILAENFYVEVITGALTVAIPRVFLSAGLYSYSSVFFWAYVVLWAIAFYALILITLIDLKHGIIPDEAVVIIGAIGLIIGILASFLEFAPPSSLGPYRFLFGVSGPVWLNRLVGFVVGLVLFAGICFVTKGRGMGMGDVKLMGALGILFGWPDVLILSAFAFIIGSIYGLWAIMKQGKTLKSAVPFGPYLAIGAATLFFFGEKMVECYFSLFSI